MDRSRRPALRGTWLGTVLRVLAPIVKLLLRSPLHWPLSRWFALFRWTSRKTGKQRTLPLSYIREGDVAYLTTGDRWSSSLAGGAEVSIRLRGRWLRGHATLAEPDEAAAVLGRLLTEHEWFRVFAGIPSAADRVGADAVALGRALASGRVLITVTLPARPS